MKKIYLFTYGTLSDPEFAQLLLNRQPQYRNACLPDHEIRINTGNRYLFVRKSPGKQVLGKIFEISLSELQRVDLWEDVPLYLREVLSVVPEGGQITNCFVYTQDYTTDGLPLLPNLIKSRKDILLDIENFMESIRRSEYGR